MFYKDKTLYWSVYSSLLFRVVFGKHFTAICQIIFRLFNQRLNKVYELKSHILFLIKVTFVNWDNIVYK